MSPPRKSGIFPVMLAETAEKTWRVEASRKVAGICQAEKGLLSRNTAWREVKPKRKSEGMEEKLLSLSKRYWSEFNPAKLGSEPVSWLDMTSNLSKAVRLLIEGGREPWRF